MNGQGCGSSGTPIVRVRLIGGASDAEALIAVLHGVDGVGRIEEVDAPMPHLDDADSSSLGLPDDIGPGMQAIEIDVRDRLLADRVRDLIGATADTLGIAAEFVDDS